jgi:outer membrane protein assembly factor BamE (lipoprotein component of BamABCDE complex)
MIKTFTIIVFLLLAVAFNANAQVIDRIDPLEKEVYEIKLRLSKLESLLSNPTKVQEHITSGEGWKSVMNWRKLTTDMDYSAVQKILGEPNRVDGGQFARWYYQNDGNVFFNDGKVKSWHEPQQ